MKCHTKQGLRGALCKIRVTQASNLAPIFPNLQAELYMPVGSFLLHTGSLKIVMVSDIENKASKMLFIWFSSTGNFLSYNPGPKWEFWISKEKFFWIKKTITKIPRSPICKNVAYAL